MTNTLRLTLGDHLFDLPWGDPMSRDVFLVFLVPVNDGWIPPRVSRPRTHVILMSYTNREVKSALFPRQGHERHRPQPLTGPERLDADSVRSVLGICTRALMGGGSLNCGGDPSFLRRSRPGFSLPVDLQPGMSCQRREATVTRARKRAKCSAWSWYIRSGCHCTATRKG